VNLPEQHDVVCRQEVALLDVRAVQRERVELSRVVALVPQPLRAAATRIEPSRHDISTPSRPLALDTQECGPEIEDQIVTLVVERTRYAKCELDCGRGDLDLRQRALLIRRQHPHMVPAEPDGLLPVL
jgi:hypothetical protein